MRELSDEEVFGAPAAVAKLPGKSVEMSDADVFGEVDQPGFLDTGRDLAAGALKIGPTAAKSVGDIMQLISAGRVGSGLSNSMQTGMQAIDDVVASPRLREQKAAFNSVMADPTKGIGDLFHAAIDNPRASLDTGISTIGSMLLPAGAAGAAVKLGAKGVGATAAAVGTGSAMNAGDTFAGIESPDLVDKYKGAAISGGASLLAGGLTRGGVDGVIANRIAGEAARSPTFSKAIQSIFGAVAREGLQEAGEETGNYIGGAVGDDTPIDINQMGKQAAYGGALGAVMGGGVGTVDQLRSHTMPAEPVAPAQAEPVVPTEQNIAELIEAIDATQQPRPAVQPAAAELSDAEVFGEPLSAREPANDLPTASAMPAAQPTAVQSNESVALTANNEPGAALADAAAPAVEQPAALSEQKAKADYAESVDRWNELSAQYKNADGEARAKIQAEMDELNRQQLEIKTRVLKEGLAKGAAANQAQEADRMTSKQIGELVRPSEHAKESGIFWEKTGADEWTARGDWFQSGRTRTNAAMASGGGLVDMQSAERIPEMAAEVGRAFELPEQITERSTQLETASEGLRPGDIVTASGKPFATKAAAQKEQKLAGKGWQIKKGAGGFVIRHQPQTEGQVAAQRTRMRNANQVDTESDSMFAAIAKLGGIRMDDLTKQWGFDPSEFKSLRGAGIKRVGTQGGMSLDRAGEALAELGYLSYDENGKHDLSELFDLFDGELRGNKHFTPQGYAKVGQAMQEQEWLNAQDEEIKRLDALPENVQDAIEETIDEYEETTSADTSAIRAADQEANIGSVARETGEVESISRDEQGSDRSADRIAGEASAASPASQRTGNTAESTRGIRSESVDPDADISLEGEALTEEQRADPDYVPFSRSDKVTGLSVEAVRAAIASDTFNHDVDVYATLDDAPEYVRIQARREGGGDVQGYWDMAKNKVALIASNLDSPESAREVARHELIGHYGLENMLNESADPGAMNALVKRVIRAEEDGNKLIKELAAQVDRSQPDLDAKRRAKEIIAIMAERNIQNSITRRVYDAIRSFLKKIGFTKADITDAKIAGLLRDAQNYLRQQGRQMEYGQPAGAFARDDMTPLESGKPLTRAEVLAKQDADARAAKAEAKVDKPKEKNVTADQVDMFNEQGSLFARAGDLKSEAFKRWFGKSQVVDATGKPRVMYHGTSEDFNVFNPKRGNDGKNLRDAIFVSPSPETADDYASGGLSAATVRPYREDGSPDTTGANILPVYVSAKNPFDFNDAEQRIAVIDEVFSNAETYQMGDGRTALVLDGRKTLYTKGVLDSGLDSGNNWDLLEKNEIQDAIKALGHDGFWVNEADVTNLAVYRSEQIKSATGNNGNYDPADANINFSRKSQDDLPFNPRSAFEVSDPNMADDVIRAMQNNKIDLKKVQDAIRSQGGSITENADAYLNEELYIGRAMDQLDKLNDNRITPLLKAVSDAKLTLDDVNQYLYARHVVLDKVNAHLASLNPTQQQITAELQAASTKLRNATATADRAAAQREIDKWTSATPFKGTEQDRNQLSGMSDADAKAILATARAKQSDYDRIAQMSDRILSETRRRMVTSGLETAAVIHSWEQQYKYYVPLMRDQAEGRRGTGSGYTVRGKETQRRTGSTKEATNILANIAAQAGNTIMRSEKAKVGRSLLDLARNHPNDKFWTVDSAPKKRTINKDSGLVEMAQDARFKEADNVLVVKENGEEHYLVFNKNNPRGMQIAAAFKNLDAAKLPWVLESTGKITRHLAQWITARNPLFWITNFARDIQGAAFNLQNTPLAGKEAQVMGNIPKAMRGYWKISRGDGEGKWAGYAREFKSAGAETGYIKVFDSPDDHMADLEKQLKQMQQGTADPRKLARSMVEAIDDYNNIIENGVRLAVYQAARDNGQTIRASASIAKNITVNFNRRGNQSTGWNALYMFMNASIQGNTRFLTAIATNRRAQTVAAALVGIGFVLDAVNRAIGGDDDETGRKKYDLIPEWERERNWIFMSPSGKYIKVPMPYGPHIALNMGRMMSDMVFGAKADPVDRALSMARITVDAFNPLGSNGSFNQLITPSVLKPVTQISENKSFTGAPLYREADDRGHIGPAYTRHFRATAEHWVEASKMLNDVSGGDTIKPGSVDIPPEVLRTIFLSWAVPGLSQTADKSIDTATRSATGKRVEPSQIPALSRFYGEAPEERALERAYYEDQRKVKQALEQAKKYSKVGDRASEERTLTELGEGDLKKGKAVRRKWEKAEEDMQYENKERRRLETDKTDDADQRLKFENIEKRRLEIIRKALR